MGLVRNGEVVGGMVINGEVVGGYAIGPSVVFQSLISQTFTLGTWNAGGGGSIYFSSASDNAIDSSIAGGSGRTLGFIQIRSSSININVSGGDLSNQFESSGTVTLTRGDTVLTVDANNSDLSAPYTYTVPGSWISFVRNARTGWTITLSI